MKKMLALSLIGFLTLNASTSALADPNPGQLDGVIAAIQQIGLEIQALSIAGQASMNEMHYQIDKNLTVAVQANGEKTIATQQANSHAANQNQNQLSQVLLQFPEQVVNANPLTDLPLISDIQARSHLISDLTTEAPGSDTLYLSAADTLLTGNYGVGKPGVTHDNYFNFDSLFTPFAYNATQAQAAKIYFQYISQPYDSFTDGIEFSNLKSKLNNMSPEKRAETLKTFVTNPTYQKFQLSVRSLLANKSMALSNLTMLIAERTPIKDLGSQAGLPQDPNLPNGYASPLQVENYVANERVNNPAWFQQMKTASPSVVQREQVMILAEIESQLERNHLDNERILATLSLLTLQGASNTEMLSKANAATDVNKVIDDIGK